MENGCLGYYAKIVHTSLEEESILKTTEDRYVFAYLDDDEIYLVDYTVNDVELTLPEGYNGKNYSISQYAFYRNDITSVTIPDSVTSIGSNAFYGCTSLTSITIPNTVEKINDYAFYGCTSITSITIENGVTSIGYSAFYNCTGLKSIVIPDSITSIGNHAFYGCSSLTIYCEAESEPSSWNRYWNVLNVFFDGNKSYCPVYWYSEAEPGTSGNYWYVNEEGNITLW